MSARKKDASYRLTLWRQCGGCGKWIATCADSPWIRQIPRDGKKQATTYFCSQTCHRSSYKHIGGYDGKTEERKRERDARRDPAAEAARYRDYYARNVEMCREKARARYWADPETARANNRYSKQKRKLLEAGCVNV